MAGQGAVLAALLLKVLTYWALVLSEIFFVRSFCQGVSGLVSFDRISPLGNLDNAIFTLVKRHLQVFFLFLRSVVVALQDYISSITFDHYICQ